MSKWEIVDEIKENASIRVIGVGGGGGNAVQHMVEGGIEGDEVYINFVPTEITTNYTNPTCFESQDGTVEISFPSTGNWDYTIQQNNKLNLLNGDIQINNISFHYPSRPNDTVLNNISIEIVDPKPMKLNYPNIKYFEMSGEEYCKLRENL